VAASISSGSQQVLPEVRLKNYEEYSTEEKARLVAVCLIQLVEAFSYKLIKIAFNEETWSESSKVKAFFDATNKICVFIAPEDVKRAQLR